MQVAIRVLEETDVIGAWIDELIGPRVVAQTPDVFLGGGSVARSELMDTGMLMSRLRAAQPLWNMTRNFEEIDDQKLSIDCRIFKGS
jgi:hypothetical protein